MFICKIDVSLTKQLKNNKMSISVLIEALGFKKKKPKRQNISMCLSEDKLIVYMRNNEYYGLWVSPDNLAKQREVFQDQTHIISKSPIDACMMLKIAVRDLTILNNFNNGYKSE